MILKFNLQMLITGLLFTLPCSIIAEPNQKQNNEVLVSIVDGLAKDISINSQGEQSESPANLAVSKATVLAMFEFYEAAEMKLKEAMVLDPDYGLAYYTKAAICAKQSNLACAAESLNQAAKIDKRYLRFAMISIDFDKVRKESDFKKLISDTDIKLKISKHNTKEAVALLPLSSFKRLSESGYKLPMEGINFQEEKLIDYSKRQIADYDAKYNLAAHDSVYSTRLARLTNGFKKNTELNFKVYLSPAVSAFSSADGSIRVFSGMMDLMKDDELFAVLAHEISHYELKHRARQIVSSQIGEVWIGSLVKELSKYIISIDPAYRPNFLADTNRSTSILVEGKFSQMIENAADDRSLEILNKNNIDLSSAVRALKKFAKYEADRSEELRKSREVSNLAVSYVTSHLAAAERAERLAKIISETSR